MNEKNTAQTQKEEREEVLKEIRQLENRKKILENKQRNEERRVRTRRLIERGAVLEGIFPLASNLSGAEVKAFLMWRCPMRSSKRFFWTREPRPPEIARCSGIRRFIPSIVTMESDELPASPIFRR